MGTFLLIPLATLSVFAVMLYLKPKGRPPHAGSGTRALPFQASGEVAQWERRVLTQLRGDRAAMERLLAGRRKRFPHAGRRELLEGLHDDYLRDNR